MGEASEGKETSILTGCEAGGRERGTRKEGRPASRGGDSGNEPCMRQTGGVAVALEIFRNK